MRETTRAPAYAKEYREQLQQLLDRVEATNRDGSGSTFEQGVEEAVSTIVKMVNRGGKIIFIGNGASASISSHQAADFIRGAGIAACAFNDAPLLTCLGNDLGYEHVFDTPIGLVAKPEDVLICISSSGASENILNGAQKGRERGCAVIGLSGFKPDNPLRSMGDLNFYVPSDGYGLVEVVHLSILHCICDFVADR